MNPNNYTKIPTKDSANCLGFFIFVIYDYTYSHMLKLIYSNHSFFLLYSLRTVIPPYFNTLENFMRLKGIIRLFIQFRESKAQLLKGVEDSEASPPSKPRTRSPLHDQLHQQFVNLFNEMNSTSKKPDTNVFKADILLAALKSDSYLFQREVRGYSPEDITEALYEMFVL